MEFWAFVGLQLYLRYIAITLFSLENEIIRNAQAKITSTDNLENFSFDGKT